MLPAPARHTRIKDESCDGNEGSDGVGHARNAGVSGGGDVITNGNAGDFENPDFSSYTRRSCGMRMPARTNLCNCRRL
jgi:hypothetical protein